METEQTPPVPEIKVMWSTSLESTWLKTIALFLLLFFSIKKAFNKKNKMWVRIVFGVIAFVISGIVCLTVYLALALVSPKNWVWFNLKQSYILYRLNKTSN